LIQVKPAVAGMQRKTEAGTAQVDAAKAGLLWKADRLAERHKLIRAQPELLRKCGPINATENDCGQAGRRCKRTS
jgi:hypothetical protein